MRKCVSFLKRNYFVILFVGFLLFMAGNYLFGICSKVLDASAGDTGEEAEYIAEYAQAKALAEAESGKTSVSELSAIGRFTEKWHGLTDRLSAPEDVFLLEQPLLQLNAALCRAAGMDYIPGATFIKLEDQMLTYVLDEAGVESGRAVCDTNISYLHSFQQLLEKENVQMLCVNVPFKKFYCADWCPVGLRPEAEWDINAYISEQMREKGIPCIDAIPADAQIPMQDLYYRTDHHWKSEYGIYTAKKIAEYLNANCGYAIDTNIYRMDNYSQERYENALLGSIGLNATKAFAPADDMVLYYPKNDQRYHFTLPACDVDATGGFEVLFHKTRLQDPSQWPTSVYSAYIYGNYLHTYIENLSTDDDHKVLVIKDSFGNVVVPYLAQAIGTVDVLDFRDGRETLLTEGVLEMIREKGYDQVIFINRQPTRMHVLFRK